MRKYLTMSLVALMAMMASCSVQVGDKEWSIGNSSQHDTPTQVSQLNTETAMNAFDVLNVAGPFNVFFEQRDGYTVRVQGTEEQLNKMTIYVKEGQLYIDRRNNKHNDFSGLQVFVTAPSIKKFDIAGSSKVTAPKELNVDKFVIDVAGSAHVTLAQLKCTDLTVDMAGSGNVTTGPVVANTVTNDIAGSAKVEMAALMCKTLSNDIAGSGNVTLNNVNVDDVKSDIAGSGRVIIHGKVGKHSEDVAGSGKIQIIEE